MLKFDLRTKSKEEFIDITAMLRKAISQCGFSSGLCTVYCPHTTAGLTINENADPAVVRDILHTLHKVIPDQDDYRHMEGNSPAHIKSSLLGSSCQIIVENGSLVLGTWQSVFFCEFDGPRHRTFMLQLISG